MVTTGRFTCANYNLNNAKFTADTVERDAPDWLDQLATRTFKVQSSRPVNSSLTLGGIPPEALAYRLGSRSAMEWVIDQYQVTTDKRSGITHDPNQYRPEEPDYIVHRVGRVVAVSVATRTIVGGLGAVF